MIISPDKKDSLEEQPARSVQTAPSDGPAATPPPGTEPSRTGPAASQHRAIDVHAAGNGPDDESEDELLPLLPPSYSEAAAGSEKDRRKKRIQQTIVAIITAVLWFGLLFGLVRRSRKQQAQDGWTRGGADGHGAWDHAWQHKSPLLSAEAYPRQCDIFSVPRFASPMSRPISAGEMYESTANWTFPLPLRKLTIHARGPLYGALVIDASMEEKESREENAYHVQLLAMFSKEDSMRDWHACRFGSGDEQGVVLVGPQGQQTATSPWDPSFKKMELTLRLPMVQQGAAIRRSANVWHIGDIELDVGDLEVNILGNMAQQQLSFDAFSAVAATASAIVSGHLVADRVSFELQQGSIAAATIETTSWLTLNTGRGTIDCGDCRGASIAVHTTNSVVSGRFNATNGLDVFTSNQDILGHYEASSLWLRNAGADIKAAVRINEQSGRPNSLLAATRLGGIALDVTYVPAERGSLGLPGPAPGAAPLVLSGTLAPIRLNLRNLPTRPIEVDIFSREAPIQINMPSTFVGEFALTSTSKRPVVHMSHGRWPRRLAFDTAGRDIVRGNVTLIDRSSRGCPAWNKIRAETTSAMIGLET